MAKGQTPSAGWGLGLAKGDGCHPLVRDSGLVHGVGSLGGGDGCCPVLSLVVLVSPSCLSLAAATVVAPYIILVALVSASHLPLGVMGVTSHLRGLGLAGTIMLRPSGGGRRVSGSAMLRWLHLLRFHMVEAESEAYPVRLHRSSQHVDSRWDGPELWHALLVARSGCRRCPSL